MQCVLQETRAVGENWEDKTRHLGDTDLLVHKVAGQMYHSQPNLGEDNVNEIVIPKKNSKIKPSVCTTPEMQPRCSQENSDES